MQNYTVQYNGGLIHTPHASCEEIFHLILSNTRYAQSRICTAGRRQEGNSHALGVHTAMLKSVGNEASTNSKKSIPRSGDREDVLNKRACLYRQALQTYSFYGKLRFSKFAINDVVINAWLLASYFTCCWFPHPASQSLVYFIK